jgi:deazaflavin-dependent oxidoreductase (nitroreductase family)
MVPVLSEPAIRVSPRGTRGVRIPSRGPVPVVFNLGGKLLKRMYCRIGGLWSRPGFRMVLLTTRGARTGRMRTVPLGGFSDGEEAWLVVGSLAGAARHPACLFNMAKRPEAVLLEVGRERFKVRPETLGRIRPRRRARRIATIAPPCAAYQTKTDREIPIVRLTQEEGREHGTGRLE